MAYGVRGAGLLNEGKPLEAVPLLEKAAALEAADQPRAGVKALLMLIEAQLEALKDGLPGVERAQALERLRQLEARAAGLAQGPQAAAWHAAGKLYEHLGSKPDAIRCLKKAVELQPDDWVTAQNGQRYKHRGIASIYEKDYAGAALD
jgi:tetratricopeptide (TPR) repeat protein